MIQKYKQTTYETCLACSLLQAVDRVKPIKISKKFEIEVLLYSLRFSKKDFVAGHIDFIARKFDTKIIRFVDNKMFRDYIRKIKTSPLIQTIVNRISLNLINKFIEKYPIVYIDAFYLFKLYHYPHFITVLEKKNSKYRIFDTWDGKEKLIDAKTLSKSIISLRNHIHLCPQMLIIN